MTQNDTVYAIQATPPATGGLCNVLLSVSLLSNNLPNQPTMTPAKCQDIGSGCETIYPQVGVLGTPVIAINSSGTGGTLYVVAETESFSNQSGFTFYHFLHALDITTLSEGINNENSGAPVQICPAACSMTGSIFSKSHIQRPGLLYVPAALGNGQNDTVYVAFSMIDGAGSPYPNGMVFGFDGENVTQSIAPFQTSAGRQLGSDGGGIWMGGSGLAFGPDGQGHNWIYLTTANGTFDKSSNWGDSLIKLDPTTLTVPSTNAYFTPADEQWRGDDVNCNPPYGNDVDFGSGGVMLLPDNELAHSGWGYLAINGEKEGYLWFIRRDQPGGFGGSLTGCITAIGPNQNVQTYATPTNPSNVPNIIHNGLAFWERPIRGTDTEAHYLFTSPEGSPYIYQFTLCPMAGASAPICGSSYAKATLASGQYISSWGITPAISSASSTDTDAILWAIEKTDESCPESDECLHIVHNGVLFGFDAVSMTQLYSSDACQSGRDLMNQATKYSVPTVANGYVYIGAQSSNNGQNSGQGTFYIFGPGATGSC